MLLSDIKNPVSSLPGIGPATAKQFANLNIFTVADLLQFYPRDYEDRTHRIPLSSFAQHAKVHTIAKVCGHTWFGYGRMKTLKLIIDDGTAEAELIAFNRSFLEKTLPIGSIIAVTGSFAVKYNALQSSSFEAIRISEEGNLDDYKNRKLPDTGIIPIYPLTEGLNQKNVRKAVSEALSRYAIGIQDEIPSDIIKKRNLLPKQLAIKLVHTPATVADEQKARHTLIYEELFHFQSTMAERAWRHKGILPTVDISTAQNQQNSMLQTQSISDEVFEQALSPRQKLLKSRLPFELTKDQRFVTEEMNKDIDRGYEERARTIKTGHPSEHPVFTMARLLQGDVGSGKTLVALFACLRVIDWGGQCALMAPTEILARQHAESAAQLLEPVNVRVAFLTGSLQASGRTQLLKKLKEGEIDIIIGTHALFSKNVAYKDLQLAIIDEQHRFGVLQRNAIIEKGRRIQILRDTENQTEKKESLQNSSEACKMDSVVFAPHLLMMSATPIPQTLALTVFGDLDVSIIRTMPSGRKPVITYLVREGHEKNAYEAVGKELASGHQAYFVYPAIDSVERTEDADQNRDSTAEQFSYSSKMDNSKQKSAEEMFLYLSQKIYPQYASALIHSRIDEDEQNRILHDFKNGKIQILVATTVVEVGVDVANATCMVIEQADHFGLSQLHQLRGRVGRGTAQSFCFLIYSSNLTKTGIARMKALRESTDGFVIAEEDLKLRGPGELAGTVQAGNLTLSIADFNRDRDLLVQARTDAFSVMRRTLQVDEHERDTASGR